MTFNLYDIDIDINQAKMQTIPLKFRSLDFTPPNSETLGVKSKHSQILGGKF